MEKLRHKIDTEVKPMLRTHGGDVELLDITNDGRAVVRLNLTGNDCDFDYPEVTRKVEVVLKEDPRINGIVAAIVAYTPKVVSI